jgi:hypothetical protein
MSHHLSKQVVNALEHVCKLGCRRVHEVIHDLESGQSAEGIDDLNERDRMCVLHELKKIMDIYKHSTCGT